MRTHLLGFVLLTAISFISGTSHATLYQFTLSGDATVSLNEAMLAFGLVALAGRMVGKTSGRT